MVVRLSTKGQLVIPKAVRQALGLRQGTQFHVRLNEGKIILEPIRSLSLDTLHGKYPDADFLTEVEAEHQQEIRDDEAIRA
jgi:antitoxin PrlF